MKHKPNSNKLLTRDAYREGVFERDGHRCVICGEPAVDAHHIIERKLWVDGGYFLDNGASVCEGCHLKAESTEISCEVLRERSGIDRIHLPEHLCAGEACDKWGNPILPNGQRLRGELFDDESVQKVLAPVLHLFTSRVKYPRTFHLPWSPGATSDDRTLDDPDAVFGGAEVVVTEKMDGECLAASSRITMADGSRRTIRDLVSKVSIGERVLGVDQGGQVVSTRITRVYNNGPTEDWRRVRFRGSDSPPRFDIYCTAKHRFFVPHRGYVAAAELAQGEKVLLLKSCPAVTQVQKQILLGALLGDGSLHIHHGDTAQVQLSHKQPHGAYLQWIKSGLGKLAGGVSSYVSGFGSKMLKLSTRCTNTIYTLFSSMIVQGRKTVPIWVANELTPLALAVWYMDDGNLQHSAKQRDRARFSVCGFTKADCDVLQGALQKFGIVSTINLFDGYLYLSATADGTERLAQLITPHVPSVMQYKLPVQYRGQSVAAPKDVLASDKTYTRETTVLAVDRQAHRVNRIRYDLETETHNYFANNILVHNCTTMYRDYLHARGIDYAPHRSRDYVKALHGRIAADIPDGWRLCGENLFAVHSIAYERLPSHFLLFSIWNERNECLPWDETVLWATLLGLHVVPVLHRGPWDKKAIIRALDGSAKSQLGGDREGYVVRLADGFHYRAFRRSVAKYVRKGHVQTDEHWAHRAVVPNHVREDAKP